MNRREFIITIAGAAACRSQVACAQPRGRTRVVGLLWGVAANDPEFGRRFAAFAGELQQLGWIEGNNVTFAVRHAVGDSDQFSAMAADLVQMRVDAIVAHSAGLASLARQATRTIPIVVATAGDLEGSGLIESLRRPGGNVTGIQILAPELMSKRIDLLRRLIPGLTRMAVVVPITPAAIVTPAYLQRITEAARALQIGVQAVEVKSADEFPATITTLAQETQAALVISNPLSLSHAKLIAASAAQNRFPIIYEIRHYTLVGGLLSYGADIIDLHRQAAGYVDKLLRGADAAELPIQQPTKFELVINLKAAKALGLETPSTLLALVDEVIE
jgi:ABC-type uncharacterized transport system substrate-binding protein